MQLNITAQELLDYHRHNFVGNPEIREYILSNEDHIKQYLLSEESPLENEEKLENKRSDNEVDLGQLVVDADTFDDWEEQENDTTRQYLIQKQKHKEQFLKEIKQKGLKLTK